MIVRQITMLGNKDHGKSTLIGNLLILTKSVTQARIKEARKYSQKFHRDFEPGFILDSFSEEREGGLTIDTTRAQIKYKKAAFELIDVPGHEELIQNMISGASYASFAILIVSAKKDERVTRQTKRHLFLAKMLGIQKIIVAVNKMDTADYSMETFDSIKSELLSFLKRIGLAECATTFIPVSAYNSDNMLARSKNMPWYTGETLLQSMLRFSEEKQTDSKLRISVQGSIESENGTLITGKVISGTLRKGESVYVSPGKAESKATKLYVKGREKEASHHGDDIAIRFGSGISAARGSIISGKGSHPKISEEFQSTVFFTKKPDSNVRIKYNGMELNAAIRIIKAIDAATGEPLPKSAGITLNAAKVSVKLFKEIAFEKFSECPELGRFTVYAKGGFSGIGIMD